MQPGGQAADWPSLGLPERELHAVRDGMYAVVNEPGGTAHRWHGCRCRAWSWPARPAACRYATSRVRQREHGYKSDNLAWELRPHAIFVAYAPYDNPRYALSLVIEHGNAGAQAAAPVARDIMVDVLSA